MTTFAKNGKRGMTLMETVIAISIIALTIPLIFTALGTSTGSRRAADDETRAAWMAQQMDDDVARAWAGRGMYFEGKLPFPDFGQAGSEWIVAFGREGDFRRRVSAAEWEKGLAEDGVVYLVKVSGEAYDAAGLPGEVLSKVEVEVAGPAVAPESEREKIFYHTLKTPRHD